MWYLAWLPHSLAAGINPFFSHAIFEPTGVNLAQNTEAPLLGLLTIPISPLMGPVARANLLMVLAMPISASSAFLVLRKWQVWGPGAALGGLVYGFCAYSIGHGLGHLQFIFLPFPPLMAMTIASILTREDPPIRLGLQLGLLACAQFFCEPEILASVFIVTAWALICAAVRRPIQAASQARQSAKAFGAAVVTTVVILAYPIWMMVAGPQHYNTVLESHYNDLFSVLDPGPLQRVSFGIHFSGIPIPDTSEAGAYIGSPLILLAVALIWRSRRSSRMQIATLTMFGAWVLSLGPYLFVDGRPTHIPLPFLLFAHLPVLGNMVAGRFSFEVEACLAAILAFGVDDIRKYRKESSRQNSSALTTSGIVALGLTLAVVMITQFPRWPYASQPVRVLPSPIRSAIPSGDPLAVTYPYGIWPFTDPMVWQAEDHFAFRLVGGYALHPSGQRGTTINPIPLNPPDLTIFLERLEAFSPYLRALNPQLRPPVVNAELVSVTRAVLQKYGCRIVIVDRSATDAVPAAELFTRVLGHATVSDHGFLLWRITSPMLPKPRTN